MRRLRKASEIQEAFGERSQLDGYRSFFLVGIGGAGMSALARMLKHRGFEVEGTDSTQSPETDRLVAEGITVRIGHSGDGIYERHAVVLTDAIDLNTSPEVARARELGKPFFRRSQALGWLLKDRKVIAVTGTHGKTTTTGMIGAALMSAGLDPLIVEGASVPQFGGPVVEGDGEWAVVEACEAYDAFHDLDPWIAVLTNLELDHVDYHGNYANLRDSVLRFVRRASCLVCAASDPGAMEIAELCPIPHKTYAMSDFARFLENTSVLIASPKQRGEHNLLNAAGALTVAQLIGADVEKAALGIIGFEGAERRQQVLLSAETRMGSKGTSGPHREMTLTVIDDYAHHPTEIRESLRAIKGNYLRSIPAAVIEWSKGKIHPAEGRLIVVFQPHLYSRTADLIPEFATALSEADHVVITDIYPAREDPIPGVSSARIAELLTVPSTYVPNRHLLPRVVSGMIRRGDVVVGMGAGNIAEFAPAFIREVQEKPPFAVNPEAADEGPSSAIVDEIARASRAKKVAVVYGGDSAEREVSILSGREVAAALKRKGFEVALVDVSETLIRGGDLSRFTGPDRPDVAFLAVHGTNAEDGATQGLFELLHIPYTGSGVQASAMAMDKQLTKTLLREKGIRVPEGKLLSRDSAELSGIRAPVIVKPNSQGSTVGLSFVERDEGIPKAVAKALQYDTEALVEEWIVGMEISVPVLGDRALPPVEIAPATGKYDFASKYTPGATEEIVPARLPEHVIALVQEVALKAHEALGCVGATRTDMIVRETAPQLPTSPTSGAKDRGFEIFTLEVNTLPGMTSTSLLPNSARAAGIEFDELCVWLVEDALRRHAYT